MSQPDEPVRGTDAMLENNDLPSLSIRRPILVVVMNLLIVIAGVAAILAVEIR